MKKILLNAFLFFTCFVANAQNNALSFDGGDDNIGMASHGLNGVANFTIQAEVLNKNVSPDQDILIQFYDATNGRFELRFDDGKIGVYSDALGMFPSTYTVPVDQYFKTALVKSGTTTKLYVNGVEVLTFTGNYTLGTGIRVGRYFAETTSSFKGELDELSFWNIAKTASTIANTPCSYTGTEANLVRYFDFNQGVAGGTNTGVTSLIDKSPAGANANLAGFALTGASSNWVANTSVNCSQIVENHALAFDGEDDNLGIASHALIGASTFTIQLNVLNKIASPNNIVFVQFYDATVGRFELRFDDGKLSVYQQANGSVKLSSFTVPTNTYFNVTFVKSGANSKLYANNVEVLSFTGDFVIGTGLKFGRYFGETSDNFNGEIDELRFWNVAKTPAELINTNCALMGTEQNLVGYYDFNLGIAGGNNTTITTATDKSPMAKHANLQGFALTGTNSNFVTGQTCTSLTGIDSDLFVSPSGMYLFPNPAINWVAIKNADANSIVEIYNITGQLLMTNIAGDKIELPSNMEPGMYVAKIKGEKYSNFVFIKQ